MIKSNFAILDVLKGDIGNLEDELKDGPIQIVIKGEIDGVYGHFDGTSKEFCVNVHEVKRD